MMQYNRLGLYVERKKKTRQSTADKEKSVDWINMFLFVLLIVVVVLFVLT
jgi:hypothetical protein